MQSALGNTCKAIFAVVLCVAARQACADIVFTPVIFAGAGTTELRDINNNGVSVGNASFSNFSIPFIYANGTFTPFDATMGVFAGISDAGVIVGQRPFSSGQTTAFIFENGVTTPFEAQEAQVGSTRLAGISPDGRYVVGTYTITASGIQRSFVFDRQTGTQTNITESAYELIFAGAGGVTNSGLVVVSEFELFTSAELITRSYLFDLNTGIRTDIDADGLAPGYDPGDINESGLMIGTYFTTFDRTEQVGHGFLGSVFSPPGSFELFDIPGSVPIGNFQTAGYGINDIGTFVGSYASPSGTIGYIAQMITGTVPEPHGAALLALAFCALVLNKLAFVRRR